MNDADSTQDRELSTEQIARAGTAAGQQDEPAPVGREGYADDDAPFLADDDGATPLADDRGAPFVADDGGAPLVADDASSAQAGRGVPYNGNGAGGAADPEQRAGLLEEAELQAIHARWKDIQAEFVEEPTVAVRQADALVAELMQRLAVMFAAERAELENRWAGSSEVSTEDLRQGMRRYRTFVERLLAA